MGVYDNDDVVVVVVVVAAAAAAAAAVVVVVFFHEHKRTPLAMLTGTTSVLCRFGKIDIWQKKCTLSTK